MTYRVYKGCSGTKCVRKFDNIKDAQTWCRMRDRVEPYRIEWVVEADEDKGIAERKYTMFI